MKAKELTADDFGPGQIANFWSKVVLRPNGCMEFTGSERVKGYGCVEMKGRTSRSHRRALAHRAAYAMTWGTFGLCWTLNQTKPVANCSLRSNGDYDVSAIAKAFGGGGHKNAAGFEVPIATLLEWMA